MSGSFASAVGERFLAVFSCHGTVAIDRFVHGDLATISVIGIGSRGVIAVLCSFHRRGRFPVLTAKVLGRRAIAWGCRRCVSRFGFISSVRFRVRGPAGDRRRRSRP